MSSSEELLSKAKEGVAFLLQVLQSRPDSHEQYMSLASRITSYVDQSGITSKSTRLQERLKLVQAIQKYAVFDADVDGCQDVARWCERQWNGILHVDQNNAVALQGLGKYWLFRAHPLLSRIYDTEAAICGDDSLPSQQIACNVTRRVLSAAASDDNLSSQLLKTTTPKGSSSGTGTWSGVHIQLQLEQLRYSPAYVEVRGLLTAATGFLVRAVNETPTKERSYGSLLIETGQAFMHLGSVHSGESSLHAFLKATKILQRAMQVPGLTLPSHLREYLREYSRYS